MAMIAASQRIDQSVCSQSLREAKRIAIDQQKECPQGEDGCSATDTSTQPSFPVERFYDTTRRHLSKYIYLYLYLYNSIM
jgi:hypothetical protein